MECSRNRSTEAIKHYGVLQDGKTYSQALTDLADDLGIIVDDYGPSYGAASADDFSRAVQLRNSRLPPTGCKTYRKTENVKIIHENIPENVKS